MRDVEAQPVGVSFGFVLRLTQEECLIILEASSPLAAKYLYAATLGPKCYNLIGIWDLGSQCLGTPTMSLNPYPKPLIILQFPIACFSTPLCQARACNMQRILCTNS